LCETFLMERHMLLLLLLLLTEELTSVTLP
jgi:hypothetical protein